MKAIDLVSLKCFVAVCELRSISRAAEQESLVTSAISKRLAHLEADLGVPLLLRQQRGVVPTPAGELLLEQGRALLSAASRMAEDVASFGTGVRGQVRLIATVSSIAERLPDDVATFMKDARHRQIHVDIEECLSRDIVRSIREGAASLGVLWDASDLQGLRTAPYRTDHLAVVTSHEHPLASRESCAFIETLAYEHVRLQSSTAVSAMMDRAAAAAAAHPLRYRAQVSNFESAVRIVHAGLGVAIIPAEIARPHAKSLALSVIPLEDAWARRRFALCYRDRTSMSRATAMLLDYLASQARTADH